MIKDRSGNIVSADEQQERTLSFLYETSLGRLLTKLLCRRFVSDIAAWYMDSRLSRGRIKKLIKKHNIDISDYEERDYRSFNDFFTRKIKPCARRFDTDPSALDAPCDSKLTVYDITPDGVYRIKGCDYDIHTLLGGRSAEEKRFAGGKCLVFRLTVDNYHRYHYFDGGREICNYFIPGLLHTVNPVAVSRLDVFGKNCREVTLEETDNFGHVACIEVGAMMVGRINNIHSTEQFLRGDEKGFFSFGGSTIVLLFEKDTCELDMDIAANSASSVETAVRCGERIGRKTI